jgi:hypothetical protein
MNWVRGPFKYIITAATYKYPVKPGNHTKGDQQLILDTKQAPPVYKHLTATWLHGSFMVYLATVSFPDHTGHPRRKGQYSGMS